MFSPIPHRDKNHSPPPKRDNPYSTKLVLAKGSCCLFGEQNLVLNILSSGCMLTNIWQDVAGFSVGIGNLHNRFFKIFHCSSLASYDLE